jgi:hypothetical protein
MTAAFDESQDTMSEQNIAPGASGRQVSSDETQALLDAVDHLIGAARRTVEAEPSLETTQPSAEPDDDEAIRQYMVQLMERVERRTGGDRRALQNQQAAGDPPATQPVRPVQLAIERRHADRRAAAPEKLDDMSRLREVANSSASMAVQSHYRKSMHQTVGLLAMTCGCMFAAYGILSWSVVRQPWAGTSVALLLVAAATALWKYHRSVQALASLSSQNSRSTASPDAA